MKTTVIFLIILFATSTFSQSISFSDVELKAFLVNENCIDTNDDGIPDIDADLNNDNEIQLAEANSILNIHIAKLNNDYNIQSIQDLSAFTNLEFLRIMYNDDLTHISNLGLENLKTFWVGSQINIEHIDISDLTQITDLRIEDSYPVNYLNIKNGSVADNFSLFYTENILYACVDDISEEYDEVVFHMAGGGLPSTDCALSITEYEGNEKIQVFPNPTSEQIYFKSDNPIDEVTIFSTSGKIISKTTLSINTMNISHLNSGIYFFRFRINNSFIFRSIIKN